MWIYLFVLVDMTESDISQTCIGKWVWIYLLCVSCRIRYFSQYFDRPDWQCLLYEIFRLWAEYWIEPIPRRPNIKWPSKLNSSPQDDTKRRWQRQRHIQDTYKDKDNEKAQISSDHPSLTHLLRTIPKGDDKDRDKDERQWQSPDINWPLSTHLLRISWSDALCW